MPSSADRGVQTQAQVSHAYFPYIDGLRAIAVLVVVLYHLNGAWLPGGFAGVDIFFVISGFVVSASLVARERTSLPSFALYFLARRFQRIAPALVVGLLATTLACALLIPDAWLSEGIERTGRFAFFGLSNVILAQNANSYFSPITDFNPYTHTWSLGVEEQFYILFPALFWMWTFGGRWRFVAISLFAILGGASFIYALDLRQTDALKAFYLLAPRFWELSGGVLLYQGMTLLGSRFDVSSASPLSHWKTAAAVLGFMVLGYDFATAAPTDFPAPGAVWPVVGTALMLASLQGQPTTSPAVALLTVAPLRWLGRISYSLYLWHWPVFVMFRWTCGLDTPVKWIAASLVALAGAYLSWRYIENPVRRSPRFRAMGRWKVVAIGALVLTAGYQTHQYIDRHQHAWSLSTVERNADDWYPTGKGKRKAITECGVLRPTLETVGEGFRLSYVRAACSKPVDAPDVFAIGDSHAMAFGSMFEAYAEQTGARVTVYNNGGCPLLSLQPEREDSPHCRASAEKAVSDLLGRLKPGDVVFLPSLRMPRFVDAWVRYPRSAVVDSIFSEPAVAARKGAARDAVRVLEQMSARGARVVLEAPNLLLNAPTYRCADVWTQHNPLCVLGTAVDRADFVRLRTPMATTINQLAAGVPGTTVFDPFPILCPPGPTCDGYRDGRPLFFDGDHMSGYGNRVLLPAFVAAMRGAVGEASRGAAD